jgi:hypothetical protein
VARHHVVVTRRIIRTALVTPGAVPTEVAQAFAARIRVDGEHRIWQGTTVGRSIPRLHVNDIRYAARHIAWALYRPTAPVGLIKSGCGVPMCVHGPHLTDDVIRQRERIQYAAVLGVVLTGRCRAGIHDLAEWGYAAANGSPGCRGCDNTRRRTTTSDPLEGATAA